MKSFRSMTYKELMQTRMKIETFIVLRLASDHQKLIDAIGSTKKATNKPRMRASLKGKKLPAKFRNPLNGRETWAGRGLKPRWLVAALKKGKKTLSDFAVD